MNSFTFLIPSSNDSVLSAISKMLYWRSLISRIVMTCVLVGHPMVNACLTSVIVDNNSGIKMTVEVTGPKGSKNRGKEVLKMEDNSKIHEGNFTDNDEYQITVETNNIDNGSFFVMHGDSENPGHAWLEVFQGTKNIFNSTKVGDDSFKIRVGKFNNSKGGDKNAELHWDVLIGKAPSVRKKIHCDEVYRRISSGGDDDLRNIKLDKIMCKGRTTSISTRSYAHIASQHQVFIKSLLKKEIVIIPFVWRVRHDKCGQAEQALKLEDIPQSYITEALKVITKLKLTAEAMAVEKHFGWEKNPAYREDDADDNELLKMHKTCTLATVD